MEWSSLILTLISIFGAYRCYSYYTSSRFLKYFLLSMSLIILGLTQLSLVIEHFLAENLTIYAAGTVEWGHILCLSVILGALASFIRDSKPHFAQFPKAYIALPLLIVISYVLVKDTYAIKEWLISIYQGGALLVALLMYGVYTYRDPDYALVITGILIFLFTYILYWFFPIDSSSLSAIWKLLLGLGIIVTVYGYDRLDNSQKAINLRTK